MKCPECGSETERADGIHSLYACIAALRARITQAESALVGVRILHTCPTHGEFKLDACPFCEAKEAYEKGRAEGAKSSPALVAARKLADAVDARVHSSVCEALAEFRARDKEGA